MIFLLFKVGADWYAIEAARLMEVLPRVRLKTMPQTSPAIAGILDYHGAAVPVVDLNAMALGIPAKDSLSTRLVLLRYSTPGGGREPLGLLVEGATETARFDPADFQPAGLSPSGAPYLGPVISDARGIIQRVEIEKLLSPELRELLWQRAEEAW